MDFKSLVLSLPAVQVVQRALDYQMIPHENISSLSILQQLDEVPDDLLRIHSIKGTETEPIVCEEPKKKKKSRGDCVVL
jgi:hypothetical protein